MFRSVGEAPFARFKSSSLPGLRGHEVSSWSLRGLRGSKFKVEVGGWRLEVGGWRLEVGGWRLGVGGLELFLRDPPQPSSRLAAWGSELPGDLKSTNFLFKNRLKVERIF